MGTGGKPKAWKVTVFLAKKHVTQRDQCIRGARRGERIDRQRIGAGRGSIGTLYYKRTHSHEPIWVGFFDGLLDASRLGQSTIAAALVVRHRERFFALTFGHGRHLLETDNFEEDFGLRATLNSIDPDSIHSVDKATIDAQGRQAREQASHPASITEFGLDIERDILRAVIAAPTVTLFGARISGRDSFVAHPRLTVRGIRDFLTATLRQYRRRDYRDAFPWVDHIQEVREGELVESLNEKLIDRIKSNDLDKLWMAVPEIVEWESVEGFRYSTSATGTLRADLHIVDLLSTLRSIDTLTVERLRHKRVVAVDAASGAPRYQWSVYRCIYSEVAVENDVFLLNNGKWYQVDRNFLKSVNRSVGQIKSNPNLNLPPFNDASETAYNERVHTEHPTRYALMDRQNIPFGGGGSRIEFCDLYDKNKTLVHVKRYGGSSVLSHLFQQGVVSATLLRAEPRFRELVNTRLPKSHRIPGTSGDVVASDYEVAFAVVSRSSRDLRLPFFSKVSLRVAFRQLRAYGYRVTLTKVPTDKDEDG